MSSIHYIGHGQLESSPENFSILHVISHELSHVQEFKNEAFRSGEDIAEIRVKVDYEMLENGKLVAVSGETTAITRKREEDGIGNSTDDSLYKPYEKPKLSVFSALENGMNGKSGDSDDSTGLGNENPLSPENLAGKKSPEDLQRASRKDYLETRLNQLEAELGSRSQKIENESSDSSIITSLDTETKELVREKKKLEEQIRLLQREEETKKNFQFLAKAGRDLLENAFNIGTSSSDEGDLLYTQA